MLADSKLAKFVKEFLKVSNIALEGKLLSKKALYDRKILNAQKTWHFLYKLDRSNSDLKSSQNLNSLDLKTDNHFVSISKDFNWGLNFALSGNFQELRGDSITTSTNKLYSYQQEISLTQDLGKNIFGRSFRKSLEIERKKYKISKINRDILIENGLFELSSHYIRARLALSKLKLQKQAKSRAIRRLQLVKSRVKDGLREAVDQYSANLNLSLTREQIRIEASKLNTSIRAISQLLHRKVDFNEVPLYSILENTRAIPVGSVEKNHNYKLTKAEIGKIKTRIQKINGDMFPKIQLKTAYKTNEYSSDNSVSISNGGFDSPNNEILFSLNFTWPIGSNVERLNKKKNLHMLNINRSKYKNIHESNKLIEKKILANIELLDKNIKSSKKRIGLAKKIMREYSDIYSKGRTDLDQVIRSEEDFIRTQISYFEYLSSRELLLFSLSRLYGNIREYGLK